MKSIVQVQENILVHGEEVFEVQMKCFLFIAEFEKIEIIRKIVVYRFLISVPVPEL